MSADSSSSTSTPESLPGVLDFQSEDVIADVEQPDVHAVMNRPAVRGEGVEALAGFESHVRELAVAEAKALRFLVRRRGLKCGDRSFEPLRAPLAQVLPQIPVL